MTKNQKALVSYIIIFLGLVTFWYLSFYPWLLTLKSNYGWFIVIFLVYHIPTWSVSGFQNLIPNCLMVILLGLLWGYVLKKTKTLWASTLFHSFHNLSVQIGIG